MVAYLPLFSQTFGDMTHNVWFNEIAIEGTDSPIHCRVCLISHSTVKSSDTAQGLAASEISVKNALAPIEGCFNATESLTLDTVQGWVLFQAFLGGSLIQTRP